MGFEEPFSQMHMIDFCSAENLFRPVASPDEAGASGVFQRFSGEIECPKCVTLHLAGFPQEVYFRRHLENVSHFMSHECPKSEYGRKCATLES